MKFHTRPTEPLYHTELDPTELATNYSNAIWDKHDFLLNILTPESKGERNQLLVYEGIKRAKRRNVTKATTM